ncbi:AAA domain-containing protein [Clostridium sp. DJ247]|uniref:AAA domain-containing protein n=1 Tax=Clostridium sp. DJ247 TaxID=2726188 RepID=UPI00162734EC|nr:AAA domain-containing protein [Clostridium sp. DJ247]MBC2581287.1 hypothetical protein [Clostridium sp. DJ247]
MEDKDKVKKLFSYLLGIKKFNEKVVRNISDYEKFYWENDLRKVTGCSVNKKISSKDWWLEIDKRCKDVYEQFFKLYLEFEKREECKEIIWGNGLIVWEYNNEKIMHPMLTTRMKIKFDSAKGVFTLVPIGTAKLEVNIFDGIDVPNLSNILKIDDKIVKYDLDPRYINNTKDIFKEIVSYLSPDGKIDVENTIIDKLNFSSTPVIYNKSVIFVRKANTRLWQQEIKTIINKIDKGYKIPNTVRALVNKESINQSETDLDEWRDVSKDLLFPLPSNAQQKEIVKRISENYGVVLQGPPGTGKSHTIANLICHLLSHGKRILVTSQNEKALTVLSDKIPEQIKPLCIGVLGNDINSLKNLDESVRKITTFLAEDSERLYKEIQDLEYELDKCKKNKKELYDKLKMIEGMENNYIKCNNETYKITDIASWVKENRDKYGWIQDNIDAKLRMVITEKEFKRFISLLLTVNKEQKKAFDNMKLVIDKLPTKNEIFNSISKVKKLDEKKDYLSNILKEWRIPDKNRCDYHKLTKLLVQHKKKLNEVNVGIFGNISKRFYSSKIAHEALNDLAHKSNDYILVLSKIRNELRNHDINISKYVEFDKLCEDFDILYKNLSLRGKVGKVFRMLHPECNYIINECTVDDKPIVGLDQALIFKLFIQEKIILRDLQNLWINTINEYGVEIDNLSSNTLDLMSIEQYINKLNTIVNWDKDYKFEIMSMLGKISIPEELNWHIAETYDYLIECIQCIKELEEYNKSKAYIEVLKKVILTTGKLDDLYKGLAQLDIDHVEKELNKIEQLKSVKNDLLELDRLTRKLSIDCPITTNNIINEERINLNKFECWSKAWKWAQLNSILKNIHEFNLEAIEEEIEQEKSKERILIKDIVAKRTWYNQILRTSEEEKRSLFAWMQAVKRIGKGTGKMASEYRKIAQSEMERCKSVIPVWIMPLNRIIENIKLSEDLFDVIIFDESSQSNIFSTCALMRAKKAIIVGDDKQISPETIGISQSLIHGLMDKYLKDIPHSQWFDLQTSLYDTALRVFPNRLMLKEHFRCVPELIGFSNEYCYYGEINPLRYSQLKEMLYPPIATVKVEDGYRELNKPINLKEAELIVNKIVELCKDKRYMGMTMGVISLLGESQSELIESMLKNKLGEEEIIKRNLICGDAYSFQGDERDIIFLSMIIANNVKFNSLTKESDIRRFNVAASRARNQLWLIHSVDLKDLNPECVRYGLLEYCLSYKNKNMIKKNTNDVFQSRFQKDFYNSIKNKGYIVTPQVKIGTYKIDFLIEGVECRAAIICDGNTSVENYNWEEHIEQQLDLRRLGWNFYRVRASEFYYDPEKTLDNLYDKLKSIGINQYHDKQSLDTNLRVV